MGKRTFTGLIKRLPRNWARWTNIAEPGAKMEHYELTVLTTSAVYRIPGLGCIRVVTLTLGLLSRPYDFLLFATCL